ncbi:hypothetical protein PFISCL1PPCAC_25980, partial [Pristionchus fissidentatus]
PSPVVPSTSVVPSTPPTPAEHAAPAAPAAQAAPAAPAALAVQLSAIMDTLRSLINGRDQDRRTLESISDRMLCRAAPAYDGPTFMSKEDVAHLSMMEQSDIAFVRELFDGIANDEEEKRLKVKMRERVKSRFVMEVI